MHWIYQWTMNICEYMSVVIIIFFWFFSHSFALHFFFLSSFSYSIRFHFNQPCAWIHARDLIRSHFVCIFIWQSSVHTHSISIWLWVVKRCPLVGFFSGSGRRTFYVLLFQAHRLCSANFFFLQLALSRLSYSLSLFLYPSSHET